MWKLFLWLTLAVWTMSMSAAEAVAITPADLPAVYRNCRTTGECRVQLGSVVDIGSMHAFRVQEFGSSGEAQDNWLLRYSVYSPQAASPSYMWMHARGTYDLSESRHALSLFVHQTNLPPNSDWPLDADPSDWDFTVTSEALLSGTAQYTNRCCESEPADSSLLPLADPIVPEPIFPGGLLACVAEGCEARARLNFVYFMYRIDETDLNLARLVFDPSRTGPLLYSQSSAYDPVYQGGEPFFMEHSFHVAPVPLPASLVLLVPALGALSLFRSRRRLID